MGSKWTVSPVTNDNKVELVWNGAPGAPESFWIRIKNDLTAGEDRAAKTAGWKGVSGVGKTGGEQEIRIDWQATGLVRAFVYLTDWSLTDDKDKKLKIDLDTIASLHHDVFDLIENAITEQVKEQEEAKKKAATPTDGKPEPPTTAGS